MDESVVVPFPAQSEIETDLRDVFLGAIRVALETLLEEELKSMIGASRYERSKSRQDTRNGTYMRKLMTSMGYLDVKVPRARDQGAPTEVIGRYRRRTEDLDDAIASAYVNGVSTRKMSDVTGALMGESVSASTVSRVTKRLSEAVEKLRTSRLDEPICYLYLDATFLKTRWARAVENVAALVAYGVGFDGHRRLLAVTIGPQESEASWSELLNQLLDRGLHGVRLVISDEHRGLTNAVRKLFPEVPRQRCVVHLERNVLTKAPARLRGRLGREVSAIFKAESLDAAKRKLAELEAGLGAEVPEAMACLKAGFAASTSFFVFPSKHWKRIRSTNGLERLHREIKRRIDSVGAFPDRDSALRLITAVVIQATEIWSDRRYLDMDLIAAEEVTAA